MPADARQRYCLRGIRARMDTRWRAASAPKSNMMKKVIEEEGDAMRDRAPLGRLGELDDMAGVITYLSSRASASATGQVIAVDGRFSTRPW